MARIRTIKPEFWGDEKLSPLPPIDRLVFLGLVSMADDCGRLVDNLKVIDAAIFPSTQDSAEASLRTLDQLGRIVRGVTASGQRIIQITGFTKHQKIDKPNYLAALPPLVGHTDEPIQNKSTPPHRQSLAKSVVAEIWKLSLGQCAKCGVACHGAKSNRYDSRPNLGEIDHVVPLADGGTDAIENLQLLCLRCNRKKAGDDLAARNLRLIVGSSPNGRRHVAEPSAPLSVSVSGPVPVPTTDEDDRNERDSALLKRIRESVAAQQVDPTVPTDPAVLASLPPDYHDDYRRIRKAAQSPESLDRELKTLLAGKSPSAPQATPEDVGRGIRERLLSNRGPGTNGLANWVRIATKNRLTKPPEEPMTLDQEAAIMAGLRGAR